MTILLISAMMDFETITHNAINRIAFESIALPSTQDLANWAAEQRMRLPIQAVREAAQNMAPSSSKKTKPSAQPDVTDVAHVAAVASHLVSRFIPAQIIRERPRDGAHSAASLAGNLLPFRVHDAAYVVDDDVHDTLHSSY